MSNPTLLDILQLNNSDKVVGLVEDALGTAPEFRVLGARSVKGTSYYTTRRSALPTTGFRAANGGIAASNSSFSRILHECFILSGVVEVDKAIAQAYEDGMEAYEMIEALGVMESALLTFGKQLYYGVSNDAKGFPGIKAQTPKGGDLTVDATGDTSSTASSVYFINNDPRSFQIVVGNDARMELGDFYDQIVTKSDGTKMDARMAALTSWVGVQYGSAYSVGRILNLTVAKPMTDKLAAEMLAKFPVGKKPNVCLMSRRSLAQLQSSRTATTIAAMGGSRRLADGMDFVAPEPTETMGVPIIVTDCIGDTDSIE